MQNITDSEFQREVEALKSHRRISVNRPLLDPDLPDLAAAHGGGREILGSQTEARVGVDLTDEGPLKGAAGSPTSGARQAFTARRRGTAAEAEAAAGAVAQGGEAAQSSRSSRKTVGEADEDTPLGPTDPSHLFWVPASMHPEISPSDFRKFLQEHASRAVREHTPPDSSTTSYPPAGSGGSSAQAAFGFASRSSSSTNSGATTPPPSSVDIVNRSTSIAQRGSTLRRQYRPENDTEDSDDGGTRMSRSGSRRAGPPTLSIDDLQRLEKLAEEASNSQDPAQLRSVLRRTMSLGVNNSALDQVDALPAESEDAPLIVPRPGQILRRAARTKIRKSSFSGDNGRTGRRRGTPSGSGEDGITSSSTSLTDMASVARAAMERRQSDMSEISSGDDADAASPRPLSDEATDSIVDAYSRDSYLSEDGSQRTSVTSLADSLPDSSGGSAGGTVGAMAASGELLRSRSPSPLVTPTQSTLAPAKGYFDIQRQQAQQPDSSDAAPPADESEEQQTGWNLRPVPVSHVPPVPGFEKTTRRAPQPPSSVTTPTAASSRTPVVSPQPAQYQASPQSAPAQTSSMTQQQQLQVQQPNVPSTAPSKVPSPPLVVQQQQQQPQQRPGKEKKNSFASWFGIGKDDDSEAEQRASKSRKKEKERKEREQAELERHEKEREKERDSSSFLGALFGKKKGGDEAQQQMVRTPDGHITAGSLLDRGMQGRSQYVNYYRYPIHIERAVYRLSHIKLANPRRPLYEQVLISNLMFWYLSIINRSQQQQQLQTQAQLTSQGATPAAQSQPGQSMPPVAESAAVDRQAGSPEAAQAEEPSSPEPLSDYSDSRSVTQPQPKAKRTGLVKPNRAPPGGRSAETAIPAAAYGAQHRQINSDLAAREQREAQAAAAHGSAGPVIAVGQVVDPRAIGAHAGYVQQQVSNSQQQQQREQGRLPPGAAPPAGRATSTSPTLSAQRMRGNSTPQESRASSSGAWLGSSVVTPASTASVAQGQGQRRPTGVASASLAGDEHKWLGNSGGSATTSRSHSKSPQPERSSEPMSQAWRVKNEGWEEAASGGGATLRKGVRGSDPIVEQHAYYPVTGANGDASTTQHTRSDSDGAIRGRLSYGDSRDSSPSNRSGSRPHTAGSDSSSTTYASARAISPDPVLSLAGRSRTQSSAANPASPPLSGASAIGTVLPIGSIPLNAGSAAMIEAARSSQSRRR